MKLPPPVTTIYQEPNPQLALKIVHAVATAHSMTTDTLLGRSRLPHITVARQLAMYLCRKLTNMSLYALGEIFFRDHGTIIHACISIESRITAEPPFKALVEQWITFEFSKLPEVKKPTKKGWINKNETPLIKPPSKLSATEKAYREMREGMNIKPQVVEMATLQRGRE